MIYIVKELPDYVELSEHLRGQAEFYFCVQSFGISYYIPATPQIRRLMLLDAKGRDAKPDKRRRWSIFEKADALRAVINALELQIRNVVLAGIEENVTKAMLDRLESALSPAIRKSVAGHALLRLEDKKTVDRLQQPVPISKT